MSTKTKRRTRRRSSGSWVKRLLGRLLLVGLLCVVAGTVYLDIKVRKQFEGERWALPAHVYSRPLELYPGRLISISELKAALKKRGYRAVEIVGSVGTFAIDSSTVRINSRPFDYWDGVQESQSLRLEFDQGRISEIQNQLGDLLSIVRLEPTLIGSVAPDRHEDRELVKLHQVPEHLLNALITIEDKRFMNHYGIDPKGLGRALVTNVRNRSVVQGGSTITQQLVKNFYLTQERTIQRKFTEMAMALLLELHYDKGEILQAYLNEVFLGQSGNRAIHGFGLASDYFFGRPLSELKLHEAALLVGMIRAPSYYNPLRHPERAKQRRDVVLTAMLNDGQIDQAQWQRSTDATIGVRQRETAATSSYASFLDLVRRQLLNDYDDNSLREKGLAIYSTVDPAIQQIAATALAKRLSRIEQNKNIPAGSLQGALVVARVESGELLAVVGGRDQLQGGFNRALDAIRPIGSLVKPAVYLAALAQSEKYSLSSLLEDKPIVVSQAGAKDWKPLNYDKKFTGDVSLLDALVQSRNIPTVDLGLSVGVEAVIEALRNGGIERPLQQFPSLFLGASNHSLLEMAQFYQTIANSGFRSPLRSIHAVMTQQRQPLARYPLKVAQTFESAPIYLLNYALQQVALRGTAKFIGTRFDPALGLAGKTGTTDGYRDSWFAGYAGNYIAVVWVGRDDNKPTGLTGASGALRVWTDVMSELDLNVNQPIEPIEVEWLSVGLPSYLRADQGCEEIINLPFIDGSEPQEFAPCARDRIVARDTLKSWVQRFLNKGRRVHSTDNRQEDDKKIENGR